MKTKIKRRRVPLRKELLNRVLRKENRRLREELGEQTAYADEYHAAMSELYHENEKLRAARVIKVGGIGLARLKNGMLWMQIFDEEGMEVNEKKFEAALRAFMVENF